MFLFLLQVLHLLERGGRRKVVARTNLNNTSSRSHTVFTVIVERKTPSTPGRAPNKSIARLTCVDLAGSERASKTKPTGVQLTEAKSINQSLSALGNTIAALSNRRHILAGSVLIDSKASSQAP